MSDELTGQQAFERAKKLAYLAAVPVTKLCEEAAVESSTVWRWRQGSKPQAETLQKLEEASERLQQFNPYRDGAQ